MISVTKTFHFCYAHSLREYEGKCSQIHGHNGKVEVEIADAWESSKTPGMTIDFNDLKTTVEKEVIEKLDHKYINEVLEGENPTAENMCLWIASKLAPFYGEKLYRITVWETENSRATWTKDNKIDETLYSQ